MNSIWRRRPSPAMVVACIALAVALGGTGYATVLNVPRNSVGTIHLRNNAVVSAKVRNGSLLAADFRAGQIPAGPAGPAGPTGPAGPAGPSDAYARFVNGPVGIPTTLTTLATLSVPQAGRYVISAKAYLLGIGGFRDSTCRLEAGSDSDESSTSPGPGFPLAVSHIVTHEFAAAGSVDFRCLAEGPSTAHAIKIAAIRVANLTNSG